jgi:hypothetical protein
MAEAGQQQQPQPKKKSNCLTIGCIVLIVVLGIGGYAGYRAYQGVRGMIESVKQGKETLDGFYKSAGEGDYDAAYAVLSSDAQAAKTKEQFQAEMSAALGELGAFRSLTFSNIQGKTENGRTAADVTCNVRFENGTVDADLELVRVGEGDARMWKINSYSHSTPSVAPMTTPAGTTTGAGEM